MPENATTLTSEGLYAIERNGEWHLAIWTGRVFTVINTGMQSGDSYFPSWVDSYVLVRAHTADETAPAPCRHETTTVNRTYGTSWCVDCGAVLTELR